VWRRLQPLARATSPFDAGTPGGRGHHWVEPRLVCEVRFTEWTDEGGLRHPAYLGLRADKLPQECRRERPAPAARTAGAAPRAAEAGSGRAAISNPTKVFWPDDGLTKGDLVDYYTAMAPHLLPYLKDRPVVLTRYPDGIRGKSFYQKDAPEFAPDWIRTVRIHAEEAGRDIDYIVIDDVESLRWVVNLGTIPLHLWASRAPAPDSPDWLVIDLDPKGAPFTDVVTVARTTRAVLDRLALPSFVKTSGATGLHILLPLGARYPYEPVRMFARLLATLVVREQPAISTVARPIRARAGKVYVDWGQNGQGQTIVAPLSVRPLPGAPVSCPLTWDEVTPDLDPARFSIRTAPARLQERDDPLAPVLTGAIDLAAALAAVERAFDGGPEPRGPAATPSRTARGSGERERGRRPIPRA
jgi:bifunctional non-homologous end joining protein LigD